MQELPASKSSLNIEGQPSPVPHHAEHCLERYDDRGERVEVFLATNAELFEATDAAWRQVAASQGPFRTTWQKAENSIAKLGNRKTRKDAKRKLPNQLKVILNSCKELGESWLEYDHLGQYLHAEGGNGEKITKATAHIERSREKSARKRFETIFGTKVDEAPEEMRPFLAEFADSMHNLEVGYGLANFHDQLALSRLEILLQDNASVEPFIKRMIQVARLAESGIEEFPGLLSFLGTHISTEGQENNLLNKALKKAQTEISDECKLEFLQEFLAGNGQYRRELIFVRDFMKAIAYDIFPDIAEKDADVFIAGYARRRWPEELQTAFTHHLRAKKRSMWIELRDLLVPHNKPARKPAIKVKFGPSKAPLGGYKRKAGPPSRFTTGPDGRSEQRGKDESLFGDAPTINADLVLEVTESQERRPIETFGVLKQGIGNHYYIQEAQTLAALAQDSGLNDFLKKYRSEPALEETLQTVLSYITTNPMDRQYSKPYLSGQYRLTEEPGIRRMRRFRLTEWPGVQRGSILAQTRIFYDVINRNGTPELLLYGVFVKQDIPQTGLPRRR